MAEIMIFLGALLKVLFMILAALILLVCIFIVVYFLAVVIQAAIKTYKEPSNGENKTS